jgi:DNA topoisomerase-1
VRDLPSKNGSVVPDKDFEMHWDVEPKAAKRLDEIAKAVKGASKLILATDPDREGEAISWHVLQVLDRKKALAGIPVERVVFNAVTKEAVLDAMRHPRKIDGSLVNAYLARRALDYLVGFTLSPVLWRKLPGARSAGRVQSVALRLVCDRELEIEKFKAQEYWSIVAEIGTAKNEAFQARLFSVAGKKLDKFGNAFKGRQPGSLNLDTKNTLVYSDKLVVTIGIEDIIVIETPDALMICHKDRSQDVKEVVNHLLRTKNYKYL